MPQNSLPDKKRVMPPAKYDKSKTIEPNKELQQRKPVETPKTITPAPKKTPPYHG